MPAMCPLGGTDRSSRPDRRSGSGASTHGKYAAAYALGISASRQSIAVSGSDAPRGGSRMTNRSRVRSHWAISSVCAASTSSGGGNSVGSVSDGHRGSVASKTSHRGAGGTVLTDVEGTSCRSGTARMAISSMCSSVAMPRATSTVARSERPSVPPANATRPIGAGGAPPAPSSSSAVASRDPVATSLRTSGTWRGPWVPRSRHCSLIPSGPRRVRSNRLPSRATDAVIRCAHVPGLGSAVGAPAPDQAAVRRTAGFPASSARSSWAGRAVVRMGNAHYPGRAPAVGEERLDRVSEISGRGMPRRTWPRTPPSSRPGPASAAARGGRRPRSRRCRCDEG